jgi:hypothetical protein
MNKKEKAKELIDKMWIYSIPNANGSWNNAKQCALICVDEILNLMIKNFEWDINHNGNIDYWQEVKKEIEAL